MPHDAADPIDWKGLMKWSLQYTDNTNTTNAQPRPIQDLKFLENAIKHFTSQQVDPIKQCVNATHKLESVLTDSPDRPQNEKDADILTALTIIIECQDIDPEVTRNLHKLGTLTHLLTLMNHPNALILEHTLTILNFALPNNPPIQQFVFAQGALSLLIDRLQAKLDDQVLQSADPSQLRLFTKLFTSLSMLVKQEADIEQAFLKANGLDLLLDILATTSDSRLLTKAMTLLDYFTRAKLLKGLDKDKAAKALLNALTAVEKLSEKDWQCSERVISTATDVLENYILIWKKPQDKWDSKGEVALKIKASARQRLAHLGQLELDEDGKEVKLEEEKRLMKLLSVLS